MEEQRIGMMYVNVIRRRIVAFWDGLFPRGLRRSPLLPLFIIVVIVGAPAIYWYLHMHAKFHTIRQSMEGESGRPDMPRPGGLEPIVLTRAATAGGGPQFLSVMLLPGMGMDVLQITAATPEHPSFDLLQAPTLQAMADGSAGPRTAGDDLRGAIELPWAGGLNGSVTLLGTTMTFNWMGHTVEVPSDPEGQVGVARGGLLATRAVDNATVNPNHLSATGLFKATDFDGHWPSTNDVSVTARLSATTLDLMVMAKNTGSQPEPMGIGWQPRLLIPSGDRANAELQLPDGELVEIANRAKDQPSGHLLPLPADLRRFAGRPAPLGEKTVDALLAHLHTAAGAEGPSVELIDAKGGFGLRLTSLSAGIRELSVFSPEGEHYVSLGMQTNYDDPLGTEWSQADPGMVTLQPGEALEWRMRLEIFPVSR